MSFEEWLKDEIENAEADAREHKGSMNSYGTGYDAGYIAALNLVLQKMSPEDARKTMA